MRSKQIKIVVAVVAFAAAIIVLAYNFGLFSRGSGDDGTIVITPRQAEPVPSNASPSAPLDEPAGGARLAPR